MPPPPGLVDAKPITEVKDENVQKWKRISKGDKNVGPGEGRVQDGEKARLGWICIRLPCRKPGGEFILLSIR